MKAKTIAKDVNEYISWFPPKVQKNLKSLRAIIKKTAPGVKEKIGYRMPAYSLNGVLVYFAAYEKHIGFYAMPQTILKFQKELTKYETSKGTIRFPIDKQIPVKLVTKIMKERVKENAAKKKRTLG